MRPPPSDTQKQSVLGNTGRNADLVTELTRARQQVQSLEERARQAHLAYLRETVLHEQSVETFPLAFAIWNRLGRLVRWNGAFRRLVAYEAQELAGRDLPGLIHSEDQPVFGDAIARAFDRGEQMQIQVRLEAKNGERIPIDCRLRAARVAREEYVFLAAEDIRQSLSTENDLRRAKERLDLALSASSLALWDWDLGSDTVYFNEGWAALLGAPLREATFSGDEVYALCHPDDQERYDRAVSAALQGARATFECEYRTQKMNGEWMWVASRGKVTQRKDNGDPKRLTGTSADITARKEAEERADFLATRDALTGLPNRLLLLDRLEQGVSNAARKRTGIGVLLVDLDNFKTINDSLGHDIGDDLLCQVGQRLAPCLRVTDTLARLGGDEFAVVLENLDIDGQRGTQHVAEKILHAMAAPFQVHGHQLNSSCSIGISLFPADGRDANALMRAADVAMYDAKKHGRNTYKFFAQEMNARAHERLAIESYLRSALARDELRLYFQPRVGFARNDLLGVEALLRWQHPQRGLIGPDKFIGVAEDSGLIVPIGEWVLTRACQQVRAWQRDLGELKVSVNVSVGQIADGERLFSAVTRALDDSGLAPDALELELTESLLMMQVDEKVTLLNRLGKLGVSVAIDDFGTGYSSLSYLKRLPVDALKIDKSFVKDVEVDMHDTAIVRAILALAHSLKLNAVAEGVETARQHAALRSMGCDEFQGYFASPPLPAHEFEERYFARC
jgi:diguanylate cyclase (GGDEF)-like protein/PAS domain S-box-containing protein